MHGYGSFKKIVSRLFAKKMLDVTDLTIKVQKKYNFVVSFVVYLTSNTKYMSLHGSVIINGGLEMMLKIGHSIL